MPSLVGASPLPVASSASAAPAAPAISVRVCTTPADLVRFQTAWSELARTALAPNSFYEPWMLMPALEAFGAGTAFRFVLVFRGDPGKPAESPPLIGFFPLHERRRFKGLPLRTLALWKHLHCFLCTPLLHRDHAGEALDAFFNWTRTGKNPRLIEFPLVQADGPFQAALHGVLRERGHLSFLDELYHRALLQCGAAAESYLAETLSTGNRKELRRQRRRLGEQGTLEFRTWGQEPHDDLERWIEDFLTLEAAGWKGREGTALASASAERAYFRRIAHGAAERGQLSMLGFFLNNRPIALKCNFLSPPGGFAFKIAFDESLSRFSPGVQLELENVCLAHAQGLQWLDSCAIPRHFMINRLWRERRAVQTLWISTGGIVADLLVGALPFVRALRRLGRRPSKPSLDLTQGTER